MWLFPGENNRGGDAARDVHGKRGEAESEDVKPLVGRECPGLVLDWADGDRG